MDGLLFDGEEVIDFDAYLDAEFGGGGSPQAPPSKGINDGLPIRGRDQPLSSEALASLIPDYGTLDPSVPFCTADNVESADAYLVKTLESLGYPVPASLASAKSMPAVLNVVFALVSDLSDARASIETLQDGAHRLELDKERLYQLQGQLNDTLHASEREVDDLRAKRKQLEATVKELREGLAAAEAGRERAKRDQAMRARQAEHELKKRETQYNKLKDRLGKFLSERGRDVPGGVEMASALGKRGRAGAARGSGASSGSGRSSWSTPAENEEKYYTKMRADQEAVADQLRDEVSLLRSALFTLQQRLLVRAGRWGAGDQAEADAAADADADDQAWMGEAEFGVRVEMMRPRMEAVLGGRIEAFVTHVADLEAAVDGVAAGEAAAAATEAALRDQLAAAQAQTEELEALIEMRLDESVEAGSGGALRSSLLSHSVVEEARREAEHMRAQLDHQRDNLDAERAALQDGLMQLSRERAVVAAEKADLERQRARLAANAKATQGLLGTRSPLRALSANRAGPMRVVGKFAAASNDGASFNTPTNPGSGTVGIIPWFEALGSNGDDDAGQP